MKKKQVILYMLCGSLGGLVLGIARPQSYRVPFFEQNVPLPVIGEMVIGAIVALTAVLATTILVTTLPRDRDILLVNCCVSLVCGYLGVRLMSTLTAVLPEQIRVQLDTHDDELRRQETALQSQQEELRRTENLLNAHTQFAEGSTYLESANTSIEGMRQGQDPEIAKGLARQRAEKALRFFEKALSLDPTFLHATLSTAKAHRTLFYATQNPAHLASAIQALQSVLDSSEPGEFKLEAPRVHYNLACYYALSGETDNALDHLGMALAGDVQYRDLARTDKDLTALHQLPAFEELTRQPE